MQGDVCWGLPVSAAVWASAAMRTCTSVTTGHICCALCRGGSCFAVVSAAAAAAAQAKVLLAVLARGYTLEAVQPEELSFDVIFSANLARHGSSVRIGKLPAAQAASVAAAVPDKVPAATG